PGQSVLEAAQRATGLSPNKTRALLGRFLFSGDEAEKPLEGLSGGERRRLSLAVLVNGTPKPPNVLILDEPTNHLDIESREALEDALQAFPGALILVSHDRALLDAVGTRTIAVQDGSLCSYLGGWQEYVREREQSGGQTQPAPRPQRASSEQELKEGPSEPAPSKNRLREQQNAELAVQEAERAVEDAEAAMRMLEDELSDPAAWVTKYETAKSQTRHTAARRAVEDAYQRLQELVD
ncbi:MAG: ATP-binding cassette domain-containing protein, partial [Solirubrobacteraceae bacterium]